MSPGNVIVLCDTIKTKGGGVLATYKLQKGSTLPVLVLRPWTNPGDQIIAIANAAATAIENIKAAMATTGPKS
jgi:hypothetical protein